MSALVLAGVAIHQDEEGRFCLNDFHRAAGGEKRHAPNEWMRNEQAKELIVELSKPGIPGLGKAGIPALDDDPTPEMEFVPVNVRRGGAAPGTYVCKELVYAYAMWISPKFHLQVIRTFDAVATAQRQAAGAEFAQGAFKEFQVTRLELVKTVTDMTEHSLKLAGLMGFEGNQGRFYADKVVRKQIGIGPLELLCLDALPSSNDEPACTAQQLGKRFGLSAQQFNKLLHTCGLQEPVPKGQGDLRWRPTEKGKPHAQIKDTFREHNSGAPVPQLRWKASVLDEVRRVSAELNLLLHPVANG